MADPMTWPGREAVASTHSSGDFSPTFEPRFLVADADGTLTVDTPGNTQIAIPVSAGYNPIVVTRIYQAGSDAIGVWLWT